MIPADHFDMLLHGQRVTLHTLVNAAGCVAQITNYGARLVSLRVPDQHENLQDVVLGFSTIDKYLSATESYHGAIIGRYANRIAHGHLDLDGEVYSLSANQDQHHLHGGDKGFESVVWTVDQKANDRITLSYHSRHLEAGFPGNLTVRVTYFLTEHNELRIDYWAQTDEKTVVNFTNHAYFNLSGEGVADITDHELCIHADHYTPVKPGGVPTGSIAPLDNTPLDFRTMRNISERIDDHHEQLVLGQGYDHNYVLAGSGLRKVASVLSRRSGIRMEVITDQPGMQFYSANFQDGSDIGKSGKAYQKRGSFCLETQHFPDSPNQPNFPSTVLTPEETFVSTTIYRFGLYGAE